MDSENPEPVWEVIPKQYPLVKIRCLRCFRTAGTYVAGAENSLNGFWEAAYCQCEPPPDRPEGNELEELARRALRTRRTVETRR